MSKRRKQRVVIYGYACAPSFIDAIEDAFAEPGDFDVEHRGELITLTTKDGTVIRAFAREIIYQYPDTASSNDD